MKQIFKWANGNTRQEGQTIYGIKEGWWKDYYEEGPIQRKIFYKNGREDGWWKSYWADGTLMWKGLFRNGKFFAGYQKEINQTLNDEPEGWWEDWDENGDVIIRGFYQNGKREGYHEDYWGDIITKGFYKNDVKEGFFKIFSWWEKDDDEELDFSLSDEKGTSKSFLVGEGCYKSDAKEGHWQFYRQNGKLKKEGNFKDGKKVGVWKSYSEEGKCTLKRFEISMGTELEWDDW